MNIFYYGIKTTKTGYNYIEFGKYNHRNIKKMIKKGVSYHSSSISKNVMVLLIKKRLEHETI